MNDKLELDIKLKDNVSAVMDKMAVKGQSSFKRIDDAVDNTARHIREAARETGNLNRELSGLGRAGSGRGGGLLGSFVGGNLIAQGVMKSFALAKDLVMDSAKLAMEAGKNKAAFETMAGHKKGNQLYDDLTNFARDSIFGNEVYKNAQTMLGFGMAVDKVMPSMKMLGDISMGDTQKLEGLTLAFSQVQATGRLMGQDLNQLINAGFNPLEVISEKTGKSIGQLKDEMEKGKISFKMVESAFKSATSEGGRFHNMTDKIAETTFGKWQALQGQMEGMKTDIGNSVLPMAEGFMDLSRYALDYLNIGKSIPETLRDEQTEIRTLVTSITSLNEGNEMRGLLLDKLANKYPDFLGNLDKEKVKNQELLGVMDKVNQSYRDKIALAVYDEQIGHNSKELKDLTDLEVKVATQIKAMNDAGVSWNMTGELAKRHLGYVDRAKMNQLVEYDGNAFGVYGLQNALAAIQERKIVLSQDNKKLSGEKQDQVALEAIRKAGQMLTSGGSEPEWWGKDAAKNRELVKKDWQFFRDNIHRPDALRKYGFGQLVGLMGDKMAVEGIGSSGNSSGNGGNSFDNAGTSKASGITGGGRRQIVINVNKEMVSGGITINAQNVDRGLDGMERQIEEALLRILNSANAINDN